MPRKGKNRSFRITISMTPEDHELLRHAAFRAKTQPATYASDIVEDGLRGLRVEGAAGGAAGEAGARADADVG